MLKLTTTSSVAADCGGMPSSTTGAAYVLPNDLLTGVSPPAVIVPIETAPATGLRPAVSLEAKVDWITPSDKVLPPKRAAALSTGEESS